MQDDITPGSQDQPPVPDPKIWYGSDTAGPPWPHQPAAPTSKAPVCETPVFELSAAGYTEAGDGYPGTGAGHPASAAPSRHRGNGARRRFGALALGAALLAGGGAGALAGALVATGATTVAASPANVSAAPLALSTSTSSTQALAAKVEPALVDIHTTGTSTTTSPIFGNGNNPFGGSTSTTQAAGTGMILKSSGLVLTNAHVIAGATAVTVTLNGQTSTHPATLVGEDAAKDIALIQVQGVSNLPTVTLGSSAQILVGDPVLAIGNALDLQQGGFTASDGIISGLNRSIQTDNNESLTGLVQTSAAISSGDSGGPLVDAAGKVIGMDTAAASSTSTNTASNIGFAIPSNQIAGLLSELEKGSIGPTTTGSSTGSSGYANGGYPGGGGYGYGGGYGSYGSGGLFN